MRRFCPSCQYTYNILILNYLNCLIGNLGLVFFFSKINVGVVFSIFDVEVGVGPSV